MNPKSNTATTPATATATAQTEPEIMASAAANPVRISPSAAAAISGRAGSSGATAFTLRRAAPLSSAISDPKLKKSRLATMSRAADGNPNPIPDPSAFVSSLTKLLWGPSLPPGPVISTVKSTWSSAWHVIMNQMAPSDAAGSYDRPASKFRFLAADYPAAVAAANSRKLHLYVGLPCPWAHRTLIVRALKGLEDAVIVSVAAPGDDASWEFTTAAPPPPPAESESPYSKVVPTSDKANGCKTVRDVYNLRRGGYSGRPTVPMLWDSGRKEVLCNESYDIMEFFNVVGDSSTDLAPPSLADEIKKWNDLIYPRVNNGVYRCGFAQSQEAYDEAVTGLFDALDTIDAHLASSRFLCGSKLTLADICLFTTLIRFDVVYNTLFRCTKKKLIEYYYLYPYVRDIYQIPSVAKTCNLAAVMDGYFKTLFPLNPGGIRPAMPFYCEDGALWIPHERASMSEKPKVVIEIEDSD